jgi:hypothetical protein
MQRKGMENSVMVKTLPPRIGRRVVIGVVVALLTATWRPTPVATAPAREAAAGTLAAQGKLACHRTLRATGWVSLDAYYQREADQDPSDQFLCGLRLGGYAVIMSNNGPMTVGPAGIGGYTVTQKTSDRGAVMFVGETGSPEQARLSGRFGWRFYRWVSNDTACDSAKYTQVGPFISAGGVVSVPVSWNGGGAMPGTNTADFRNKWWRWEVYYNSWPDATSIFVILKNVTDNKPELSHTFSGWPLPSPDYLRQWINWIHEYRDAQGVLGPCTNRWMYLLVGKNLGPNERIPPAVEVEGVSGGGGTADPGAPSTPTGLTVR